MIVCVAEKQGSMLDLVLRLFLIKELLLGLNLVHYVYACLTKSGKLLEWFVFLQEEYQLCYDAIEEYLLNDCVYGNC